MPFSSAHRMGKKGMVNGSMVFFRMLKVIFFPGMKMSPLPMIFINGVI